jgi:hypothetical protein
MQGARDLESYNHLVNGVLLVTIGLHRTIPRRLKATVCDVAPAAAACSRAATQSTERRFASPEPDRLRMAAPGVLRGL